MCIAVAAGAPKKRGEAEKKKRQGAAAVESYHCVLTEGVFIKFTNYKTVGTPLVKIYQGDTPLIC